MANMNGIFGFVRHSLLQQTITVTFTCVINILLGLEKRGVMMLLIYNVLKEKQMLVFAEERTRLSLRHSPPSSRLRAMHAERGKSMSTKRVPTTIYLKLKVLTTLTNRLEGLESRRLSVPATQRKCISTMFMPEHSLLIRNLHS